MLSTEKKDLDILHMINRYIMQHFKNYNFKVDNGLKETAFLILDNGSSVLGPLSAAQINLGTPFVPDLLDFNHKKIIEYEEEAKPNHGPKIVKRGHFEESNRDTRRDHYYHLAGFSLLKIWENEFKNNTWKDKIDAFLGHVN